MRGPYVTQALIGINVGVYLLQLLMGAGLARGPAGSTSTACSSRAHRLVGTARRRSRGRVVAPHHRCIPPLRAAALLDEHARPLVHRPTLGVLRPWSLRLVYLVSGLAGSAGALLWSPNSLTVGASGAIWGIMGAALILEARRIYVFGGQAMGLVVLNLALTFLIPDLDRRAHRRPRRGGGYAPSRSRASGGSRRLPPPPSSPSASSASPSRWPRWLRRAWRNRLCAAGPFRQPS